MCTYTHSTLFQAQYSDKPPSSQTDVDSLHVDDDARHFAPLSVLARGVTRKWRNAHPNNALNKDASRLRRMNDRHAQFPVTVDTVSEQLWQTVT